MTIGYIDGFGLAAVLSPGPAGDRGALVWDALDAACAHRIVELEVPSAIGRSLDRMAWIWALHTLSMMTTTSDVSASAIDLAWLGAPPLVALHVACAEHIGVDHFITADDVSASWASIRGLNVLKL